MYLPASLHSNMRRLPSSSCLSWGFLTKEGATFSPVDPISPNALTAQSRDTPPQKPDNYKYFFVIFVSILPSKWSIFVLLRWNISRKSQKIIAVVKKPLWWAVADPRIKNKINYKNKNCKNLFVERLLIPVSWRRNQDLILIRLKKKKK